MYSVYASSDDDLKFILDNLCDKTVTELKLIFGENYKQNVFNKISDTNTKHLIMLKRTHKPVGIYGLIPLTFRTAGIFFLSTDDLMQGNIITLLKGAKNQIDHWMNDYDLIMDSCYKYNPMIQKWLRLMGFNKSQWQDDNFQIYFRGNEQLISKALKG